VTISLKGKDMGTLAYRALGAAVLDPATYEVVEADRPATYQALSIVLLSSLAAGIGAGGADGPSLGNIALLTVVALASWLAWAGLILQIGGRLFPELHTRVDYGQLVRTIGFAATPGLIQVMGLFTSIRPLVFVIAWVWMLAAMIVAVRQALDYRSTRHAIAVSVIALGVILSVVLVVVLALGTAVS